MMRQWNLAGITVLLIVSTAVGQMARNGATTQGTAPISVLLEKGIYQEETAGDLAAAAQTYRQVIEQGTSNRQFVAQAMYRLGMVSLKQKQPKEAMDVFARLRAEYPEQKELAAKADKQMAEARKGLGEKEVAQLVDDAVNKVSTMAETDPRLPATLAGLEGLDDAAAVKALAAQLGAQTAEVRRAAIYILWIGPMKDISLAVPELVKLLNHQEPFTSRHGGHRAGGTQGGFGPQSDREDDAGGFRFLCPANGRVCTGPDGAIRGQAGTGEGAPRQGRNGREECGECSGGNWRPIGQTLRGSSRPSPPRWPTTCRRARRRSPLRSTSQC